MLETLKSRGRKTVTTRLDLEPVNIIWSQGSVKDAENLLKKRSRQISLVASQATILETNDEIASILLDFGCEIHGGIRIQAWQGEPGESIKVRIRFVRIDVLEKGTLVLKSVLAQLVYKDVPYRGSFHCNDDLLNRIWMTGAYTMHLNMQEYLWDGIKRDRLVWIADMHPMIKTIMAVFGEDESVKNSLDFIRKETPLPGWMNKIASYTMWYVVILYDWYVYTGDWQLIYEQREYLKGVAKQLQGLLGEDGKYLLDKYECFVDWPSCDKPEVVNAGMKAIHCMAMERLEKIFAMLLECDKEHCDEYEELQKVCRKEQKLLHSFENVYKNAKSAAALCALAGLADIRKVNDEVLCKDGSQRISTYMGYYILTAMAQAGNMSGALACLREYWGGMLSLGATTFWEDFDIEWMKNAAPIDRFPQKDEIDVHGTYGGYCYQGYRHSLCHAWASAPASWLTEQILGVKIIEPGCRKLQITPNLGDLEWAEGTYPTPFGEVSIKVRRKQDGTIDCNVDVPKGVIIQLWEP